MIVGAVVGGVVGWASSTVICTELHRQGYVPKELLDLEKKYQSNFDHETYWGYRIWADPVVRGMRRSAMLTKIVALFGKAFIEEVAHRVEPERKGSKFGSLILKVGVPLCRWNYNRFLRNHPKIAAFYGGYRNA